MKKIILAAAAASFLSTGAHAVQLPAEGQVCSDIHSNISVGINNPELSDYRKCVMIQHDIDTAFTYKTFHVRTGDKFTSFPVEDLAKMNRGERVDHIRDVVVQEVVVTEIVEVVVEKIVEDKTRINELIGQIELLESLNGDFADTITDLTGQLTMAVQAVEEAAMVVQALDDQIIDLSDELDDLYNEIEDLEGDLATAVADARARVVAVPSDATVTGINLNALFGTAQRIYISKNDGHEYPVDIAGSYDAELSQDQIPDADSVATVYHSGGANYSFSGVQVDGTTIPVYGIFTLDSVANVAYLAELVADEAFADGFERGFSEGYDKGFRDGFEQGYNVGYDDGFADGVASVQ